MNINFPPVDERFIKSAVEEGYYSNATELVRDAVRQLRRGFDNPRTRLLAALEEGLADVRAGRTEPFTPALFEQITRDGLRDAADGIEPDPDVCP